MSIIIGKKKGKRWHEDYPFLWFIYHQLIKMERKKVPISIILSPAIYRKKRKKIKYSIGPPQTPSYFFFGEKRMDHIDKSQNFIPIIGRNVIYNSKCEEYTFGILNFQFMFSYTLRSTFGWCGLLTLTLMPISPFFSSFNTVLKNNFLLRLYLVYNFTNFSGISKSYNWIQKYFYRIFKILIK